MSQTTPWIVDFGASDHMTDAHHLFSTYSPCTDNLKVKIADGTLSPVAGKGSIRISESITLNLVLYDLSSKKTIGSAKEHEGLYYFDEIDVLGQSSPTNCNSTSYPKDSELLLWHKRMGHPTFQRTLRLRGDMELQTNRETLVYSRRPKSKFNETLISEALKELEPVIVPTPWEYGSNSDQVIKNQGYQQGQSDHTMSSKQSNDGRMTILIVYVDDIILTRDDTGKWKD
ncbi:hypothetical protein CK203_048565 [Vitis vinifera]|uniref:Retrovirus-related Pol polyprotein from transposon TNT 1-94-like beta-barrel domain-containing protein n=1 Tax=Vitis vinifera TaxID=29760 RepID=A0A438HKA0_VITVI|nr:hypothetical protein CK203_048565 [Vitis vinifera]